MFLALGFLAASLLSLLMLPAVWARAVRLSTRRLQMQLPLSMGEIVAERDQLRAEFATQARRIEQRAERLVEQQAAAMSEVGRQTAVIAGLETQMTGLLAEIGALSGDLAATRRDLDTARTELGAAHQLHWDALGQIADRDRRVDQSHAAIRDLQQLAEERRGAVAALETRIAGLEVRLHDLQGAENNLRLESANKAASTLKAMDERDFARIEASSALHKRDQVLKDLEERDARIAELEKSHRSERRARNRAQKALEAIERSLDAAKIDEAALRAAHERALAEVRAQQGPLAQQIEDLRARNAALEGALATARREHGSITPAAGPADDHLQEETARLRQAISDVGADVSRLVAALNARASQNSGADEDLSIDARMRNLQSEAKRAVSVR